MMKKILKGMARVLFALMTVLVVLSIAVRAYVCAREAYRDATVTWVWPLSEGETLDCYTTGPTGGPEELIHAIGNEGFGDDTYRVVRLLEDCIECDRAWPELRAQVWAWEIQPAIDLAREEKCLDEDEYISIGVYDAIEIYAWIHHNVVAWRVVHEGLRDVVYVELRHPEYLK